MVDDGLAQWFRGGAEQGGQDADAVLAGVVGEFYGEDVGTGGDEVVQADRLLGN